MRIKALYSLYIILVIFIFASVVISGRDFVLGINEAIQEEDGSFNTKYSSMRFILPNRVDNLEGMNSTIGKLSDSTAMVEILPYGMYMNVTNLKAVPKIVNVYIIVLFVAALGSTVLAVLIMLFLYKLIIRLRKAINMGQIFYLPLIKAMTVLGFLLIIMSALEAGFYYINYLAAIEVLHKLGYYVQTSFSIDFILGIFGLSLLFISQVFRIGHQIEEEQSLTV